MSAMELNAVAPAGSTRPAGSFSKCDIAIDGSVCAIEASTLPMACARCAGPSADCAICSAWSGSYFAISPSIDDQRYRCGEPARRNAQASASVGFCATYASATRYA